MKAETGLQMVNLERSSPRRWDRGMGDTESFSGGAGRRVPPAHRRGRRGGRRRRRIIRLLCRLAFLTVGLALAASVACRLVLFFENWNMAAESVPASGSQMEGMSEVSQQEMQGLFKEEENADPVIVLDAGHGGDDPGAEYRDIQEKEINLDIAKKLQAILEERGYRVALTREDDSALSLKGRVKFAVEEKAAAFVSIHQNALEKDTRTSGIQTYCNRAANEGSVALTDAIHRRLLSATGAVDRKSIRDSDFYVVEDNPMPACLVETGFLTSREEREKLLSEDYQETLARAMADGIEEFLNGRIAVGSC